MAGQMSLFELVGEDERDMFEVKLPPVGEYEKEERLAYEKEVLGVYVSGHPLEEYSTFLESRISARTSDFLLDEETNTVKLTDRDEVVIGGILTDKKIKYTKNDKVMAFITIEDLYGSIEVILFPRDYEKNSRKLEADSKVFVKGRVQVEDEKDGKLIGSEVLLFEEVPRRLVLTFPDKNTYLERAGELDAMLADSDGVDGVTVKCRKEHIQKNYPPNRNIHIDDALLAALRKAFGEECVAVR
jgi:DNA polymerase-3 subunit alpha